MSKKFKEMITEVAYRKIRFILISAIILLSNYSNIIGQDRNDSLYNPFVLEFAPIQFHGFRCGTGQPKYLNYDEVLQAVQKSFEASGINLKENYWYEAEGIHVYLQGYSPEDEIGFLLVDHSNMGPSFYSPKYIESVYTRNFDDINWNKQIETRIEKFEQTRKEEFQLFLDDKSAYRNKRIRWSTGADSKFCERLKTLEPNILNKSRFNKYFLQYKWDQIKPSKNNTSFSAEIRRYILTRFEPNVQTATLPIVIKTNHDALQEKVEKVFEKLKDIESDEQFLESYMILNTFIRYNSNWSSMDRVLGYNEIKLVIMNEQPISNWLNHVHKLDEYKNKYLISLEETLRIVENNNKGTSFILPIRMNDKRLMIPSHLLYEYLPPSEDLKALRIKTNEKKEYIKTLDIEKSKEIEALKLKYNYDGITSYKVRDSLTTAFTQERNMIIEKYRKTKSLAYREISENRKILDADLIKRNEDLRTQPERAKNKTINALQEDIEQYIKWAKSQMGG